MDEQTRLFLCLLGSELTGSILEQISRQQLTSTELAGSLGRDSRDVSSQLQQLAQSNLARSRRIPSKKAGRPRTVWVSSSAELVGEFEGYIRELRHRLIDADEDD